MEVEAEETTVPMDKVRAMISACFMGDLSVIQALVAENSIYACQQDFETGQSPLMIAASTGNGALCQYLLEQGAPWNAVDRNGDCAGNYATNAQHWGVVNLLVDWGVRAEFILGLLEREQLSRASADDSERETTSSQDTTPAATGSNAKNRPVELEPSTKPDYLRQRLKYTADGKALLDSDQDAVMMQWEAPLMQAHARILAETPGKRVLNVGFGMGIIDSYLQECQPSLHIIIEAHPDVYKRMRSDGWDQKPNVRICFGKWQDVMPQLVAENMEVDAIFFDTVCNKPVKCRANENDRTTTNSLASR